MERAYQSPILQLMEAIAERQERVETEPAEGKLLPEPLEQSQIEPVAFESELKEIRRRSIRTGTDISVQGPSPQHPPSIPQT